MNRWIRQAWMGVALLVLSLTLAGCARTVTSPPAADRGPETPEAAQQDLAATAPAEPFEVVITANEWGFAPAAFQLTAGQPVRLVFQNEGKLLHDVAVLGLEADVHEAMAGEHGQDPHGMQEVKAEGEHAGDAMHDIGDAQVHVNAEPGEAGVVEFTPAASGTYQFVCTLKGHKEAGMVGKLTVSAAHGG
ncbi:MAG: multicopper oxidase domain-containing protein [Chloroflexi bacterium]|nr:multicopper oxidase domain-containing protein [Chloroflexota bacterium]